ncbi:MAG: hypothetical protein WCI64_01355 [Chlorobium sp.]
MNCERYASYPAQDYYLVNNIWNAEYVGKGKQCINPPQGKSFSWNWDWSANPTYVPFSYPSVIYGNKPWDPQETSAKPLPRQMSKITQLHATHDYVLQANGRYNVAYDLWLTEGAQATIPAIRVEIMVWVEAAGNVQPYGVLQEETPDYWLYVGMPENERHWSCYSFKLKKHLVSATVDLRELIQYLVSKKSISPDLYLADVEFGTEIWDGKGEMKINNYQVSVV